MALSALPPHVKVKDEVRDILENCKSVTYAVNTKELVELATRDAREDGWHYVEYDVPGKGRVLEAKACQVKNGVSANYVDPYMRRRDPNAMVIADTLPTDKVTHQERFNTDFSSIRTETFEWLKQQDLAVFFFHSGVKECGYPSMVIAPANAGFFALGLSQLQGIIDIEKETDEFDIRGILFIAPPFRHTHYDGKQVVVHNRSEVYHEIFSFNLYPGPSAKKGVYSILLHFGQLENWLTAHASSVRVSTPYGNKTVVMHEGASGGGKSEMLEHIHRNHDGSIIFGTNSVTGERKKVVLPEVCSLEPNTDDMTLCLNHHQKNDGKLYITDAESGWFIRTDHITHYGCDPDIEAMTISPKEPLLFLNIDAQPNGTALVWDHIEDEPGKKCPNPRYVYPRHLSDSVVKEPVAVDVRSFGLRAPVCTKDFPTYGIVGLFHVLPPAIAWLWRLVAPRGFGNPSIVDEAGMQSEGVGSFWPFVTGKRVRYANLLLDQVKAYTKTKYVLIPNQHIGAWEVKFNSEWISREYLARRSGSAITRDEVVPSRCPLLGYSMKEVNLEGQTFGKELLRVETQPEVGEAAYDIGAEKLVNFFKEQLELYRHEDALDPLGKKIIEAVFQDASVAEYDALMDGACLE
ncbi:DUF4914 family protein [Chitinivibrio alkaliphilus]|uniref:DUF4914 domain-containing protein n=1 Tax=Chitinivibrio alkaliphilus ACht1 TaxID=1313304 RepID=U7D872_9BACT|nr:DUF4914 family protein [Chitinivibrio alkaliphilus]ERP39155.1 hypothetical protein CALK_0324 [Chitinivibrio alkaliphilus ACht1]